MKIKRILLFILIFFLCLFIKNNVNAYVINEGGIGKFYLQDLPFDDSGAEGGYKSVFLLNDNLNEIYCIKVENYNYIGFSLYNNYLVKFDNDNKFYTFSYYKCNYEIIDNLYVGDDWLSLSADKTLSIDSSFEYIGGTTALYPCFYYNNLNKMSYSTLPDGINWGDNFYISTTNNGGTSYLFYPSQTDNIVPVLNNKTFTFKLNSYNGSAINFDLYTYTNKSWSYSGVVSSFDIMNFVYMSQNIYNSSNGNLVYSDTNQFFKGLYEYNNFPYILNSQEDLAKGEEDIIIMPRRFQKHRGNYFWFAGC